MRAVLEEANRLMTDITGKTRLFGIAADPVEHVKTPQVLNALFRRAGFDGVLVPFHVAPDRLAQAFDGFRAVSNLGGFVVTVPHKTAAVALCDVLQPEAARVGAVNCVRRDGDGRLVGALLDGIGFVNGLRGSGIEPRGLRVFLAGAGGAASAIAFALAEAGIARLTVANRNEARSLALVGRLRAAHPALEASATGRPSDAELVINATSLGLKADDPLPFAVDLLGADHIVADIVMEPQLTPLLAAASKRGCRIQFGRPMLEQQAELMARHMGMPA